MSARNALNKNTLNRNAPNANALGSRAPNGNALNGNAAPARHGAVPDLQRQLLMAGISQPHGRLWFARSSADTLATTYAALISLQRKKLIAPERATDPRMMSWKVTKAGKAAVADKQGRR
jgi:hypothetical protein